MVKTWARLAPKIVCATALAVMFSAPTLAQSGGETLAGKTVTMVIGFGPGGGYDRWGRTVARHIGKHLPGNPTVVPQNMPGAGSLVAANHLYSAAPKDGTSLGIIARDAALAELTGMQGARFDATKFSWIGSPAVETNVCVAFHTAKVKTAKDLFEHELIIGNTGPGTGTYTYPKALTGLLGMKFKQIAGFPASTDVFLAIERGEVEGICESLDSALEKRPEWIKEKKLNILFQAGAEPNPQIKDVPFIMDFAKTEEQKQALRFLYAGQGIGRPFVAPPDLPADRLKMLRDAFNATMKDPDFIADVKKQKIELEPQTGEQLEKLIKELFATPKPVIQKVSELVK
jgi:tripartite-type tricarboxylate transporter receptor subunit TctC